MVKWISQRSSEPLLWVRVLLGAQKTESFLGRERRSYIFSAEKIASR